VDGSEESFLFDAVTCGGESGMDNRCLVCFFFLKPYIWKVTMRLMANVHQICSDRVTQRGDNHQTLRVETPPDSSSVAAASW